MVLLLRYLDALIPPMQLLVHRHGLFDLVVLEEDGLRAVELFVEDGELGLHAEVVDAFDGDELVDLAEVVGLRHVAEGGVATFGDVEVLLLDGELSESLPVGFGFGGEVEGFEDFNGFVEAFVFEGCSEFNQGFI